MPLPDPLLRLDHEPAPAKLNLMLHVRGKREDGFHSIESLFAFARDGDEVAGRATPPGELTFNVEGPFAAALGRDDDNLVLRAAHALRAAAKVRTGAALRLTKILPVASGIGGGSADAAATLRLLNRLWGLNWPTDRLLPLALSLGSDVPACLIGGALKVGGRGERLQPVGIPEIGGNPVLLVNPGVPLSTGEVFAGWKGPDSGPIPDLDMSAILGGRNDLQTSAISLLPAIRHVLTALDRAPGRLCARMSGSGATCFALFDDGDAAASAAAALRNEHPEWWLMESALA